MKKCISYVFIVTFLLTVITACGSGEEPLQVYTTNTTEEMDEIATDIEDATGVEMEFLNMSTGESWSRAESEAPHFGADMQIGMMESYALMAEKEDFVEPYLSESWEDIPEQYKDEDGKWFGTSFWYNEIIVNKDLLEEKGLDVPESWEDLLDPQYEDEIIAPSPASTGTAYLFVSSILQLFGEEEGWEYLEELDENVVDYSQSGSDASLRVSQGEYAIGIDWDQPISDFIEQGYPVESIIPEEGVGYNLDTTWIYEGTDKLEDAQKVVDYMATDEFMEKNAELRSMVTKPGITDSKELEESFIDYDAVWATENRERVTSEWEDRFHNR
ncbi:extracellular solute-binding protein [Salicibibacter cibi]|uniref:Extracellular solute-binding protein n=1 Tax=Salicibibacter cibi TaxID=2743001 RepID=A0A7T7CG83_9BACI|nr:extracellular solute-binding protein [Salicibibacter cibi]QQK80884.1 extracellular solute-binding protein [Salicibibacter cibi]